MRYLLRAKNECPTVCGRHYDERPAWLTLAVLSLFGLLVLAAVSCGAAGEQRAEEPTEDETQSGSSAGSDGEQAAVDLEHPSLGDENAPVVLTEYADYQ